MPTPEKPDLDYSYTAHQQAQGNNSFPGTQLDNDLANLKQSIDETIDFASLAIRDDGKLQNAIVTKNALAEDVLLGVPAPRPWEAGVEYAVDDTATINNSLYICEIEHTSGVFADDLSAGRWALLIEFTVPAAIPDGAVTEPKHATGGVSTRALADGAVTTAKIPDQAVTLAKLAAVVQAALLPVGISADWDGPIAPSGWVFKYGQALSRVTYAALMSALTVAVIGNVANGSQTVSGLAVDLRNLGLEGAPVEGSGVPAGTTVASVTATTLTLSVNGNANATGAQLRIFPHGAGDGSTTFNVPDDRDYVTAGRGNMGGTAANRITPSGAGGLGFDTTKLGSKAGVDRYALTEAQLPALTKAISASGSVSDTVPAFALVTVSSAPPTTTPSLATSTSETPKAVTVSGTVSFGGGTAHTNLQPTRVCNRIIFTGVA